MIEKNSYNELAANWWASQIRKSQKGPIQGLESFEESLAAKINHLTSLNGSLNISTYGSRSYLLDEIAAESNLQANIPIGFEMKILFNNVFVYDSCGLLVANY